MNDFFTSRESDRDSRYKSNYIFITSQKDLKKHIDKIMQLKMWIADTETTGSDPHTDKVILFQLGNHAVQYLIDTRDVQDLSFLKERLEDEKFIKIFHNAKFDYKMIKGTFGLSMEGLQCTMLLEQLLWSGLKKFGFSMADCALRYLGIIIDKEQQTTFLNHTGPFTLKQLNYAALDCVYPYYYSLIQYEQMRERNLQATYKIECNAIPAFSDMEYYGMLLDKEKWEQNMAEEEIKKEEAYQWFQDEAAKYVQKDLFSDTVVNPSSSKQVAELFKRAFDPNDLLKPVKNQSKMRMSTDDSILKRLNAKYNGPPIVKALQSYREHDKRVSTYGQSYLDHIHFVTKRFHPDINQIGTDTGRPSGRKPSMLNIPADKKYRSSWIAGPGRKILTNDYGTCELRIIASMSKDVAMCKGFNAGVDYHTYTATQFIIDDNEWIMELIPNPRNEPGKAKLGNPVLDQNGNKIRNPNFGQLLRYDSVVKEQRDIAKAINFGLAYGEGVGSLAERLNISIKVAYNYVTKFNKKFLRLVKWLDLQKDNAAKYFYAETCLGRKRYFNRPTRPQWKNEWNKLEKEGVNFNNPYHKALPVEWKDYYSKLAAIRREGGNFPIQGASADITKIAMHEIRRFIKDLERKFNNGKYLAHVALQVYDEIVVDCPEEYSEVLAKKMEEIMESAGRLVIKGVPVETGCIIENTWTKG